MQVSVASSTEGWMPLWAVTCYGGQDTGFDSSGMGTGVLALEEGLLPEAAHTGAGSGSTAGSPSRQEDLGPQLQASVPPACLPLHAKNSPRGRSHTQVGAWETWAAELGSIARASYAG